MVYLFEQPVDQIKFEGRRYEKNDLYLVFKVMGNKE